MATWYRVVSKRDTRLPAARKQTAYPKGDVHDLSVVGRRRNELTSAALDPKSHTPEFKYCACRVEKIDDQKQAERDVKTQYAAIRSRMGIEVKEV